ncbi:MAG: ShlB/FhaC/HecB family hemolysin secretion/activation protein [Gammaproteobacteria bacterium]
MRHSNLSMAALLAVVFSLHHAQAAPPPANPPTPGAVQATLPKAPAPAPKQAAPVSAPQSTTPSVAAGGVAVTVKQFDLSGNTVFDTATLQAQISQYVGQSLTLADLYKVAQVLTRFYQAHDYGLARVTVPEQKFEDGSVKLQVIEGEIGAVRVQGNTNTNNATIMNRAASVKAGTVFTNQAAERAVLLVNDLPGVQARAVMVPGSVFGTADMVFNVRETRYQGYGSIDDYGRPAIGRWRLNAGADINSLSGHGDRLSADITHSEASLLNFGNLTYSLPLGPSGGQLAATYNRATYHVGGPTFGPLDISGSTSNVSAVYQYPLVRTANKDLYWGAGVLHTGSKANSAGTTVTDNSLNLLQATVYYVRQHRDGSYYTLDGQFFTNGKHNDGTAGNNGEQARFVFDGSYVLPFTSSWTFTGRGGAQYSPNTVVDNDKYSLGGPYSVRGFLPAEQRGDSGLFASGEIQRSLLPSLGMSLGAFLDSGRFWNKAISATGVPGSAHELTGAGLDLSFSPADGRWNARLQWAYAIGGYRPSDGNGGGHIWATFGMNF